MKKQTALLCALILCGCGEAPPLPDKAAPTNPTPTLAATPPPTQPRTPKRDEDKAPDWPQRHSEKQAAGVVPYARVPDRDGFYVLLGLENRNDCRKKCWTDFFGKRNPGEVTPSQTAGREFAEETGCTYVGQGLKAWYVVGPKKYSYLVEIDYRTTEAITANMCSDPQMAQDREKGQYCWVELQELLDYADASTRKLTNTIPEGCMSEFDLYRVFRKNLIEGGALRKPLNSLGSERFRPRAAGITVPR